MEHVYAEMLAATVIEDNGSDGNFFVEGLEGASCLGYVTLTNFENAPIGTIVVHRGSRIAYTKRAPNQWHEPIDGETISDEYMTHR